MAANNASFLEKIIMLGLTSSLTLTCMNGYQMETAMCNQLGLTNILGRAAIDAVFISQALAYGGFTGLYAGRIGKTIINALSEKISSKINYA